MDYFNFNNFASTQDVSLAVFKRSWIFQICRSRSFGHLKLSIRSRSRSFGRIPKHRQKTEASGKKTEDFGGKTNLQFISKLLDHFGYTRINFFINLERIVFRDEPLATVTFLLSEFLLIKIAVFNHGTW